MIICDHCHSSSFCVKIISYQTRASWRCDTMWYYVSEQSHPAGYQLISKKIFTNHKILAIPSFQHDCILFIKDINISVVGFHCRIQYFWVQVIIPVWFHERHIWNLTSKQHLGFVNGNWWLIGDIQHQTENINALHCHVPHKDFKVVVTVLSKIIVFLANKSVKDDEGTP